MTNVSRESLRSGVVVVIQGGRSAEREVSLLTGEAVGGALAERGYRIEVLDPLDGWGRLMGAPKPAAAVIALHGRWGEDGCVQGLLECLEIPYTGSGVLASALAMDKAVTKSLLRAAGVATPEYLLLDKSDAEALTADRIPFGLPAVVKPSREGSSVGIGLVETPEQLAPALEQAAAHSGPILLERYIEGREFSVAVLEGESLGTIEIVPARPFYDYEAKYAAGSGTRYLYPAPISADLARHMEETAVHAFERLNCGGVARIDFMVDADERPWFIEVNTLPGMTATSLVPKMAAGVGLSFQDLCERILLGASLEA